MRRRVLKLLEDVRAAVDSIQNYTAGKSESAYLEQKQLRRSVEREFEINGEALRRLDSEFPAAAARITDARKIIAFRNVLAHGYDAVSDDQVWIIVTGYLPTLIADVRNLIEEESRE